MLEEKDLVVLDKRDICLKCNKVLNCWVVANKIEDKKANRIVLDKYGFNITPLFSVECDNFEGKPKK